MRPYAFLAPLDAELARSPDTSSLLARRSKILHQLGDSAGARADWDRAVQLLDAKLQISPDNLTALRDRAKLHFDAGRWEQAVSDCDRALALLPDHVSTLERRAQAYVRVGRWQQAKEDLTRVLGLRPDRIGNWPDHCRAAYELGQVDEARTNAERLIELAGDDIEWVEALVWKLLMEQQAARLPDVALALGKRASELGTRTPREMLLGGVYVQLGRYPDATRALGHGEGTRPGESVAFADFWLAISHHHQGDHEKARQAFQRGVRNWKAAPVLTPDREGFLQSTWQEARELLFGSETAAARS
jgi:tetratricopeptide (TPR) repeat protein